MNFKKLSLAFIITLVNFTVFSQHESYQQQNVARVTPISEFKLETEKRGIPSAVHIFNNVSKIKGKYVLRFTTKTNFTCFGIAWETSNPNIPAGDFKISYQHEEFLGSKNYGKEITGEGENKPEDTETGLYWSELLFSYDEYERKEMLIYITVPEGVELSKIRVDVMDLSGDINPKNGKEVNPVLDKAVACPAVPTVIQRADWCGTYTACTNATYTPTTINPTHTVIHHGASPNTYTDGYAVVRSYWNYHVNSLGWSDIGYNYLIDKYGNLFLGRKNANYLTSDVRGSHAGNSNGKSIGINFLGNGDVTLPTVPQLNKLYELLAWWYKRKALDPLSSADIILQSGGNGIKPRICGHKDVNIGGTACPGTAIYNLLGTMRTQTASIINACTQPVVSDATNLNRTVAACPTNTVNFSWTNSGTGWYIQLSTSSNFSTPYIKYVSGLTSFTGPTGFVLQSNGTTPLTFSAGQTYYWRIWDNSSFKVGSSFTLNTAPASPGIISGNTSVCSGTSYTYSVAAVSGATSYTWTVPTGTTITSGQNTNSITVSAGATNGNISVSASNSCGTSALRTLAISSSSSPSQPGTISGLTSFCSGTTNTYSIAAVSGATSYTWTVPTGTTISSGAGTNSITAVSGSTSGNISVRAVNTCGSSTVRSLAVSPTNAPAYPGVISGTTGVCVGTPYTYSIAAVPGATSYTWTLPNGATINSGQNSTSISATFANTSGNVAVSASNSCGSSSFRTLNIITSPIASLPGVISGSTTACSGTSTVFSVANVANASSYNWTVPTGSTITSGQGTISITTNLGSTSGNVSVSATNSCGTSALRTLAITPSLAPSQPGTISGLSSVCSGNSINYSINAVSGATSYNWTVPSGTTISSGAGTNSITVISGSTSGNISVSATNSCGTSAVRTLAVSTSTACNDIIKPTTVVTNPNWAYTNFTANFNDNDNSGGSGIKYRFYQVTDLNGTDRRANKSYGFYNDNFNTTIHSEWTTLTGTWAVINGKLAQSDQVTTNSNMYLSIPQVSGNQYMYNWKMKISGTGSNRRAGLHFFCEDATQSNRLNSYMVYFRADGNVAQIYEYLNNVMSLKAEAACTVNANTEYDYKVVLNTVTGEINVYQNDNFIVSWTDATPLTLGNQVSLRTGECTVEYDDFRIFKSRGTSATVSVGNSVSKEIKYHNQTVDNSSGQIVSYTTDVAKNISNENSSMINIDHWGPYILTSVKDGLGSDISTQTSTSIISANWNATTDPNNIVVGYSYAIGTSPGTTNILGWTENGMNLNFTKTGLNLSVGTTYYVSVRSVNLAGLNSSVKSSNGVQVVAGLITNNDNIISKQVNFNLYPNPTQAMLIIDGLENNQAIEIYDLRGQKVIETSLLDTKTVDVSELIQGVYFVSTIINGKQELQKFIKE